MNNLILECIEAIEEDMDDGYLVDEDSRLKFALRYLANDEEISELYELIKTGKAPAPASNQGLENINHPYYRVRTEESQWMGKEF